LLVGLAALMLLVAAAVWATAGWWSALLPLLTATLPWIAWRMSGDLDALWLELEDRRLVIQMRRRRQSVALVGARARRLDEDERRHLERLASSAGVTASTGGFDSRLLGEFDLYASDLAHGVLVETADERLVVTPDDPAELVAAIERL
jgi:hypothetical protein